MGGNFLRKDIRLLPDVQRGTSGVGGAEGTTGRTRQERKEVEEEEEEEDEETLAKGGIHVQQPLTRVCVY